MSSAFRIDARGPLGALALAALAACGRQTSSAGYNPDAQQSPQPVVVSQLYPGGTQPPAEDPRGFIYDGDPAYIADGKQYFSWYNCNGCHFNGGGGIGPSFMNKTWRYGGRIDQIYNSIAEGRPNGMPTWRSKIPDAQIWEIAAYVRSLSAPAAKTTQPPNAPPPPTQPPADPNHQGGQTIAGADT
ncbi:MAG TPA: c-type cytochrome [Caulobacteraceae bacterium]|jgi:cytochrome c oxidase cbb3-type subunit 3|nr:c-type cytochrome [Caulobacteraceae bacterium]